MDKELFVEKYTNYIPKLIDSQITKNLKELLISDNSKWKSSIDSITIEEAITDVSDYFSLLTYCYCGYEYYKDIVDFNKIKDNIISFLRSYEHERINTISLCEIIYNALYKIINDGHLGFRVKNNYYNFEHNYRAYVTTIIVEKRKSKYVVIKGNKSLPVGTKLSHYEIKEYLLPTITTLSSKKCFILGVYSDINISKIKISNRLIKTHIIKSDLFSHKSNDVYNLEKHKKYNVFNNYSYALKDNSENILEDYYSIGKLSKKKRINIWNLLGNLGGSSSLPLKYIYGLNNYCNWETDCAVLLNPIITNDVNGYKQYSIYNGENYDVSRSAYEGTLYVVMNKQTCSSGEAAIMIAKSCKNVVLVGSASAGVGQFGEVLPYQLKNSHIILFIPHKVFNMNDFEEGKGILPNYWIDSRNPIKYIEKYLKFNKKT